ncbi:alpha-L-arabinofuranosidase C-terminal domain-containing protein [Flavobacterium johnsoniae]|uniref:non-reducing end alpha-L-arabinofuranosidase n=1 Tax=Flavobacterium johnsoniae (strain ATCC 17061 / DSM 2064 / JCM 8514 / BCRC 14874 / CCUG 350202 / NBRC 14942 / NCIMB 11054 / UW101) TaxID=376686 RepID=A5FF88_FLAJ1|nr:alpha-L-arabinofuranosidase C-terminal domain-containing protein [Flavobacterium johnsoniae]ABQ06130.1 Candidate alpha-L-arabinofuranosidase; Glycoside hydrolase family 51 [Flavobacterium johnsoniae UW101]OXE98394.1 alpha-L-arabinofuranosidase [Flavobacterium johnsoniae UW101]WQG81876.1 alpha-L-arabinofuranosidase C-terminal domain-containing protein [Flavobacterium johnsoniae UW101]SHK66684.1 alpha-N-arabinofuranosidase [Flavobacterium johnsoniae]
MKNNFLSKSIFGCLLLSSLYTNAQKANLEVDASKTITKIQPTMFGLFFEDINFAADGGLYAEMIKNRSFEFDKPMMGWEQPNTKRSSLNKESGSALPINLSKEKNNSNFCRVEINNDKGYTLINEGFRGMGVKKDAKYNLSLKVANHNGAIKKIIFQLINKDQKIIGETSIVPKSEQWTNYTSQFTAVETEAKAKLKITFEGNGTIDLDMVSLFPEDTWKNRKNGLRKDLVQLLYDVKPGFLRFPGGCIVEGRTLSDRYQWKKSVGDVEERKTMMNRWNVEFNHKQTPDYFQSFGLGFFEYFQLSEDIGAEPLPILSCGMACQYNTGELAPMDELDPYIQDALDLIEFANSDVSTKWGKLRSDMGHPKPFNLKYIGVGNEQWGKDYIDRYKVFEKAIKAKYPKIIIVSGTGPSPKGEHFDYAMTELKKLNAELIDEHYYESPKWFRENAGRYDNYDRKGPKIFAGEYAAQSVSGANPNNRNNWECAFSEAAFMTGLERNAEVVNMTSYAPLMAHEDAWQWTPDMIWFNNLQSYGSANYYVQQLFSTNKGTDLLSITQDGKALIGQNNLYASAVKDVNSKEIIVKLVNTAATNQEVSIDLKGAKLGSKGSVISLASGNLQDENTFVEPRKISPKQSEYKVTKGSQQLTLPAYSVTVLKLKTI